MTESAVKPAPGEYAGAAPDPKVLEALERQNREAEAEKAQLMAEKERERLANEGVPDSPEKRKRIEAMIKRHQQRRAEREAANDKEQCALMGGPHCPKAAKK